MPFDGIVTKCTALELSSKLVSGRVEKIFQPEKDEINLLIRAANENFRLVLSSNANFPRIHLTKLSKDNPSSPPLFCMILRKHLTGGRIISVEALDYERVIQIRIESTTELGDLTEKTLIIEIMGRYSNVILVNGMNKVIDSMRHIDFETSSVREIMPARDYIPPPPQDKQIADSVKVADFVETALKTENLTIEKYILNNVKGFSPLICREICYCAGIDPKMQSSLLKNSDAENLRKQLGIFLGDIKSSNFKPCIIYKDESMQIPVDFYCLPVNYAGFAKYFDSINFVMDEFFSTKDSFNRQIQKKSDIVKVLNNSIDRCNKKLGIQQEALREAADRDDLKLYGELIIANLHVIPPEVSEATVVNYYSSNLDKIKIPLENNLSPQSNAQRYFKKYAKAKSTFIFTDKQIKKTIDELAYLESVQQMLEKSETPDEINEIREELIEQGYIKSKTKKKGKKKSILSEPLRFMSSEGFEIFVGKNNHQNDRLTLKTASSNDMWLHTREIPGSHVIIRKQQSDVPEKTIFEAAMLAAYHSKASNSSNVPVDYTVVKNVKKPSGAKPGMVIYNNFKTITVTPDKNLVLKLQK